MGHSRYGVGLIRGLLALAASSGLSAYAAEPQDVRFPWKGVRVQQFSDESPAGELTGKLFHPAQEPAPFVVFMHGCAGLKLDNVDHWADFFLKRGVGVLMVDSLGPRNRPEACTDANPQWVRRRADDVESAHAWLSAQPYLSPGRVLLMGQSQGGTATLVAAQRQSNVSRQIVGAIAMYPTCNFGVNAKFQYEKPLLILIGDEDTWTPASACEQLKAAQTEPTGLELTVYPGARHSFDNPGVYRMALGKYPVGEHAKSRDLARERIARFVEQRLR